LFFGVNYTFGDTPKQAFNRKQDERHELQKQGNNKAKEQNKDTEKTNSPKEGDVLPYWTVQLGAFSTLTNAESFIGEIPQQAKDLRNSKFRIVMHTGNYLVISGNFGKYSAAKSHQKVIEKEFRLRGFSKFIAPEN